MSFKDYPNITTTSTVYTATVNDKDDFEEQLPSILAPGDIVMTSPDCAYIYTGSDWNLLSTSIADCNWIDKPACKELLPQICKCCGAPLKNHKCDYCGVEYA